MAELVPLEDVEFGSTVSGIPDHAAPARANSEPEVISQVGLDVDPAAPGFQYAYSLVISPSGTANESLSRAPVVPPGMVVVGLGEVVVDVLDVELLEVELLVVEDVDVLPGAVVVVEMAGANP
jgi:hypothetical protein